MARSYEIIAQRNPAATTEETFYTVPAGTQIIGSTYTICNQGADGSFRLRVNKNGEANDAKQFIHHDEPVSSHRTFPGTIGMTLNVGDVIKIYASHANFSFNLFGTLIT